MRMLRSGLFLFLLSLIHSINVQAQWVQTNGPNGGNSGTTNTDVRSLAVIPSSTGGTTLFALNGNGIFLSTNNGTSWTLVNSGLAYFSVKNPNIYSIAANGGNLFAATDVGLFLLNDKAATWTGPITSFPYGDNWPAYIVQFIAVSDTNLLADIHGSLYISSNNGTSWNPAGYLTSTRDGETVSSLSVAGTPIIDGIPNLFEGTNAGLYVSWSYGAHWTSINLNLPNCTVSAENDESLFAWGAGGVYHTTNINASWSPVNLGLANTHVNAFAVYDSKLFAGTDGGVFLSTNSGASWAAVNTGLTDLSVKSLAIAGPYLFAGGASGFVSRRFMTDMVTVVDNNNGQIPTQFALDQNYPNPFNPATTVSFSLPSQSFVSLKVFDALGREVATLTSEEMSAGNHSMRWDASKVPSGIYLYRLQAGSFTETRKAVLLK